MVFDGLGDDGTGGGAALDERGVVISTGVGVADGSGNSSNVNSGDRKVDSGGRKKSDVDSGGRKKPDVDSGDRKIDSGGREDTGGNKSTSVVAVGAGNS